MKTNTLSALLIVALATLVSSCGMTSYYASNVYTDGIYYRATPESRAKIIAANTAQLEAALESPTYDEDYVASDSEGNLWLVSNNSEGYYASRLHRFDSPTYTYPFWVGLSGAIVYDAFGRPYYWDSWRWDYPYWGHHYYSSWWWDDWYRPYHPGYHPGYNPGHHPGYNPGYHPGGGGSIARHDAVYTPRSGDGARRTTAGGNYTPGRSTVRTSTAAPSRTTTYSGNHSSRISQGAVARKGQPSSSSRSSNVKRPSGNSSSSSSYSTRSNSSSSSRSSSSHSSSYSGGSHSSSSGYSGGSHSSSSGSSGGGRRR